MLLIAVLCSIALAAFCVPTSAQTEAIRINAGKIQSDVERRPFGINTDWMLDNDASRSSGATPLSTAIANLGAHYLRYPGGAESDAVRFDSSFQPYLARVGSKDFPAYYAPIMIQPQNPTNFVHPPLGFDSFMATCQANGCIPTIVVNHNAYYTSPDCPVPTTYPTAQALISDAANFVAYAKSKSYGIRFWEIGNESFLASYGCNNAAFPASLYAADVQAWSAAMKAKDPSILVGANGDTEAWFQTVLTTSADYVDFLAFHNYPYIPTFSAYQAAVDETSAIGRAEAALSNSGLSAATQARMKIAITETNTESFSSEAAWQDNNDLSHAMSNFELLLQTILFHPKVSFVTLWATRWINNGNGQLPYGISDTLSATNQLNPSGRAFALLNDNLGNQLVEATWSPDNMIHSYATYDQYAGGLNIFLVNRDTVAHSVTTTVENFNATSSIVKQLVFTGTGISDYAPTLTTGADLALNAGQISSTIPALSITIYRVQGMRTTGLNLVKNAGFELSTGSPWSFFGSYWPANPDAASGTQSLLLHFGACAWQPVTLVPGARYTLSANAKVTSSVGYLGLSKSGTFDPYVEITSSAYSPVSTSITIPNWVTSTNVYVCAPPSADATVDDVVLARQ